jgi:hypothetical protein
MAISSESQRAELMPRPAAPETAPIGTAESDRTPGWMHGLSMLAVGFAAAALAASVLFVFGLADARIAEPSALGLAVASLICGVASAVARLVQANLSRRLVVLSEALDSSATAHLIVRPDGSMAYSNAAFRRFFPDLKGPPLTEMGRAFAAHEASAREFVRLTRDSDARGAATGRLDRKSVV